MSVSNGTHADTVQTRWYPKSLIPQPSDGSKPHISRNRVSIRVAISLIKTHSYNELLRLNRNIPINTVDFNTDAVPTRIEHRHATEEEITTAKIIG